MCSLDGQYGHAKYKGLTLVGKISGLSMRFGYEILQYNWISADLWVV